MPKAIEAGKYKTIIAAMSASLALIYLDQTGVALTLNQIQHELAISNNSINWIVNAYLLALAVLILLCGRLGDIFGHKKVFMTGMGLFLISSFLCGIAESGTFLIFSRTLQGIGGALVIPNNMVLIAKNVKPEARGKAIGTCMSLASIFLAFGPTIGGLITNYLHWRYFYFINIPVSLLSIYLASIAIKEEQKGAGLDNQIDWLGFALFAIGIGTLVIALMQAASMTMGLTVFITLATTGLIFLLAFIYVELRSPHPMVQLRLFNNKSFSGGNLILFCLQICHVSSAVFWVIFLQKAMGYSAAKAGLYILPVTIPVIVMAKLSGKMLDRHGPLIPAALGLFISAAGVFWVAAAASTHNYLLLFPGFLLYGIGAPLVIPATVTFIISSVSADMHGMASGLANTMRQIGGTIGLSIIGTIIAYLSSTKIGLTYTTAFQAGMYIASGFITIAFLTALMVFRKPSASSVHSNALPLKSENIE